MRFEDLPNIPLDTVNLAHLRETARAAVTQCVLATTQNPDGTPNAATGDAAAARTTAVKAFFDGVSAKLAAIATAQAA